MSGRGNATLEEVDLVLTARRRQGRILLMVRGQRVDLTYGCFALLTDLVGGRFLSPHGYVSGRATTYPMAVSRLRKAIDRAAGQGVGKELVETGMGEEFRLAPQATVAVDKQCTSAGGAIAQQILDSVPNSCPRIELLLDC